jgi:RNA polymerase sigma-70 factor, ECF subfamily
MDKKTDLELVFAIQEGDILAFEKLVKRYQYGLLAFTNRIVRDSATAQEVVQDAFLKVYKHIDKVDPSRKFSTYLFEITKNTAISALRVKKHTVSLWEAEEAAADGSFYEDFVRADERARVRKAVDKLEGKYKKVVTLYYFGDLSYQEISEKLRLPLNTIRTHLARAKTELRRKLQYEKA